MDVRAYFNVLRRRILLIGVVTAACLAVASLITWRMTPIHESTARVIVSSAQAETTDAYAGGLLSAQRAAGYVELVGSTMLAKRVKAATGVSPTLDELSEEVEAKVVGETPVIEISFTDSDPARAQLLAQSYADQLARAATRIEKPDPRSPAPLKVTVIDPASDASDPVWPKPLLNLLLAGMFGVLLGAAAALARELFDTSITDPEVLGAETTPTMGRIAAHPDGQPSLVTELEAHAPRVEAFRILRTNVQFAEVDTPNKVLVVTSANQGEGKTSTAVNLALSLAQAGSRTLLVDGDLRRPRVAGSLGLVEDVGLTNVLVGRAGLADAVQRHPLTGLDVLAAGKVPPNSVELLQSHAVESLIERLRATYDFVIIDSPPLLPVTDAALIAARTDGALLVLRHGRTTRADYERALDRLAQVDARPVGLVMNMVPPTRANLGYTYQPYALRRS